MLAAALVVPKEDEGTVSVERAAWALVLGDEEMNGIIPNWVLEQATKEFMSGAHGRFFPKVAEFVAVCKRIVTRYRWAIVERRRLLDAKVIRPISAPTGVVKPVDLTAMLNRAFPGTSSTKREVVHDDGWAERRADVMQHITEADKRRAAE